MNNIKEEEENLFNGAFYFSFQPRHEKKTRKFAENRFYSRLSFYISVCESNYGVVFKNSAYIRVRKSFYNIIVSGRENVVGPRRELFRKSAKEFQQGKLL